ncbi:MAG: FtsW/RodA/SpoVE family cell cycle protein [Bacteroidales bacterium]|nr:FtsW/RodA/SpoVE family cell cycle protein [Bacteroidales bacterium]
MKKIGRIFHLSGDKVIWILCFILSAISIVFVYSSIGYTAIKDMHTSPTLAFARHVLFIIVAYLVGAATSNIGYQLVSRIAVMLYIIAVALLFFTFLTGSRWIPLPLLGRFQPSELAKIIVLIFTARTIALYHDKLTDKPLFWATLIPIIIVAGLILPENLSTALLVMASGLIVMFFGGVKIKYILEFVIVAVLIGSLGLFVSYKVFHSEYADRARQTIIARAETWSNRVDHFMHPDEEEVSQENLARMAVADGGLFKMNIGGTVHARLMTQANNDFIYSIIIEEVGSIPGILIFLIYTIFFYRCCMLAYWSGRRFGGLLILGIGSIIYIQAIVHMCVCVGAIPVTGQTLPLVSTGGTAYIITGFAVGIIQSVAKNTNQRKKAKTAETAEQPVETTTNNQPIEAS